MAVLADVVTQIQTFVNVFVTIYSIVILLYIITSWIRLPYSPTLNRVQRFLYDVSEPYLRLFRRFMPSMGPLDLSPMVALIVLVVISQALNSILDTLH
jgi:YggT family protein